MMKILICDDDNYWIQRCREELNKLADKNNISIEIQSVSSGPELLFFLDSKYIDADLIYMDLHMPEIDGFETARIIRRRGFHMDIVFCTKDGSRAADAFDVDALNYLVKGETSEARFEKVFLKAEARSEQRSSEYIMFSYAGEHVQIAVDMIRYFEVRNRIVTVHYQKENYQPGTFSFYSSLSKIEKCLQGRMFVRIHNSYLVGERYILRKGTRQVTLTSGEVLPVGRAYTKNLMERCLSVSTLNMHFSTCRGTYEAN